MKIVIIGGGSAGTTCAFELRKYDKDSDIIIVEKSSNLEYSPCALPYLISNEIKNKRDIFIFDKEDYEDNNIELILNTEVILIDKDKKTIVIKNSKEEKRLEYDILILASGSNSAIPKINNIEKIEYFKLKNLEDAIKILNNTKKGSNSIIIGAGIIGLELAYSLSLKGEKTSIIESQEHILPNMLDNDMSELLKEYLEKNNIKVFENKNVIDVNKNKLLLKDKDIKELKFDKLFLSTGVKPNLELAKQTGLKINHGIIVNESLQTSDKNIYSCGDCVESTESNTDEKILSQLGTTSVRQAKVIVQNILGNKTKFPKVINNTITKLGNLYVGSVGITQERATKLKIKTIASKYSGKVCSEYYPSEDIITIKIISNEEGIIIGSQIIGTKEVVGRLDLLGLAIFKKLSIEELSILETCYNPPSAPIFDPLTIASEICLKKLFCKKKSDDAVF